MSRELFDVVLDTQAKVERLRPAERGWSVNHRSSDEVDLTRRTTATVDKWYFLQGGPGSLVLHVRFDVTRASVTVSSISIE